MSWLEYLIENNSNDVLELGLALWMSSNDVVSFRSKRPGTWLSIVAEWQTAKDQNYLPTCFYVMNALAILIRVQHVRSANPLEDWRLAGSVMMFEPFERIHRWEFPLINLLSKL